MPESAAEPPVAEAEEEPAAEAEDSPAADAEDDSEAVPAAEAEGTSTNENSPEAAAAMMSEEVKAVEAQDARTAALDLRAQEEQAQAQLPFGRNTMTIIITNLVAALLSFAAMTLTGQQQDHLIVQGLICLALPLAYLFRQFSLAISQRAVLGIAAGLAMVAILFVTLVQPGLSKSYELAEFHKTSTLQLEQQNQLIEKVREYSIVEEPMVVFGRDCWIYTAADSYSATRYATQPFSTEFRPDLNDDFYRQVGVASTTVDEMLLVGRIEDGRIEQYPNISEYELVFSNEVFVLYHRIPPP